MPAFCIPQRAPPLLKPLKVATIACIINQDRWYNRQEEQRRRPAALASTVQASSTFYYELWLTFRGRPFARATLSLALSAFFTEFLWFPNFFTSLVSVPSEHTRKSSRVRASEEGMLGYALSAQRLFTSLSDSVESYIAVGVTSLRDFPTDWRRASGKSLFVDLATSPSPAVVDTILGAPLLAGKTEGGGE